MSNAIRIAHGNFGRVALLDMDASLVHHAHPHCHVLIKASGADTQFSVHDRLAPLTDDTAVLINAWEPHAYVHDLRRPRTNILALYIEPAWLAAFRPNWTASGAPGFFDTSCGSVSPRITGLARDLAALMLDDPGAGQAQQALLSALMIAVIERFVPWRSADAKACERIRVNDFRIRRALAALCREPGRAHHMGRLAREAGLSRAHFFRLFQQNVKVSPLVFLNALRLEEAVAQVVGGDGSMAEIGDDLGFSAPAHFTRFFRNHAGAAPHEFRMIAHLNKADAAANPRISRV